MTLQAINRSSGARRWFGTLAVVTFCLKALLPPGFMLASVDGRAQLVMCLAGVQASDASMPSTDKMTPMPGMDHGTRAGHSAHSEHAAHAAQNCPYAQANGAGLSAQQGTHFEPWFIALQPARVPSGTPVLPGPPPRHRAPRGPPIFA